MCIPLEACAVAAENINDIPTVSQPHAVMLDAYNKTCRDDGLCSFEVDDKLANIMTSDTVNPADLSNVVNEIPIEIKSTINFGSSFVNHPALSDFFHACDKEGGMVECVDGSLYLDGTISEQLTGGDGEGDGIKLDIELFTKNFPYCFPKICDGLDLSEVLQEAAKEAMLKSPQVKANLNPTMESVLKGITFEQLCAISGLPTCALTLSRVDCPFSSGHRARHVFGSLLVSMSIFFSLW